MRLSRKNEDAQELSVGLPRAIGEELSPHLETRNLAILACLAFTYFIVGKLVQRPASPHHSVTEIWLPAGIALAAFLLRGNRVWPGIFVGAFVLSLAITGSVLISLGLALGNTSEGLIAAYLVNKFANGINAYFKTRDVLGFILFAAVLVPALCAAFGVGLLCLGGHASLADFRPLWFVWWVGDMLGILLLTPFLVLLLGHKHRFFGLAEPLEITALIAGLSLMCVLNFGPRSLSWLPGNGLLFLCAPFLVWSALRFCPLEAAGATLVMGGFAIWGSVHGLGPFENAAGLPLFVGGFMAVGAAMTMTIAAANAEQKSATKDVLGLYCALKDLKESEIRVLQDTVEALQVELARNGARQTSGTSQQSMP